MKEKLLNDYRKIDDKSYLIEVYDVIQKEKSLYETFHWHFEPEVLFCYYGNAVVTCNGQVFSLNKGDVLFINSSMIHSVHIYPNTEIITFAIDFESLASRRMDDCDKKYIVKLISLDSIIVSGIINESGYKEVYKEIHNSITNIININTTRPYGYQLELKSAVLHFMYLLVRISKIIPYKDLTYKNMIKNYDYLKKVFKFYDINFNKKIKVEELAEIAHMSTTYFCKYFKKIVGRTPVEYLNIIRIKQAENLLLLTNDTVADIAFKVGFDNISYFSSTFKKYNNVSPSEFRMKFEIPDQEE